MPTYDYRCSACGHQLEIFHGISEKPRKTCPKCKKPRLERLISAGAGLVFKGSGFYQTDYRSKSYSEAQKKDSAPAAEPAPTPTPTPAPAAEKQKPEPKKPGKKR